MSDQDVTISDPVPEPAVNGSRAVATAEQPVPLEGCLYCHTTGSTALGEAKSVLGTRSAVIRCSACGAVASFEPGADADHWRIRYTKYPRAARFYYVMVHLGQAGWLDADHAIEESTRGFIQRQRLQQAQRGDLVWLKPHRMEPPPPLMSPAETVYLMQDPAALFQGSNGTRINLLARGDGVPQDTGRFYVTDLKLHLLGRSRDWSHKLADIRNVEFNQRRWRIFIGDGGLYYQGENMPGQTDAQLFVMVVKLLMSRG